MDYGALDEFGKLLMERVRDEAITDWDMILDGRMGSDRAKRFQKMVGQWTAEEILVLYKLIPQIVDSTLHHLLWTLEQEEWIDIAVQTDRGIVNSLREVSDGLAGDLVGWIPQFSKQRYEEDDVVR